MASLNTLRLHAVLSVCHRLFASTERPGVCFIPRAHHVHQRVGPLQTFVCRGKTMRRVLALFRPERRRRVSFFQQKKKALALFKTPLRLFSYCTLVYGFGAADLLACLGRSSLSSGGIYSQIKGQTAQSRCFTPLDCRRHPGLSVWYPARLQGCWIWAGVQFLTPPTGQTASRLSPSKKDDLSTFRQPLISPWRPIKSTLISITREKHSKIILNTHTLS